MQTAQDVAYRTGRAQRARNLPRSESSDIADIVYADDSLRRVMLKGYDDKDAELAAEMS